MSTFVSGVLGKFSYSVTWMFAAAIAIGAGCLLLTPSVSRLRVIAQIAWLNGATALLVYTGTVAAVGFVMGAISTPLYQLLEGYRGWPRWLRASAISWQKGAKSELKRAIKGLRDDEALEESLLLHRLGRYPVDDQQIAPTRLGNALRAFESYGMNRYRLDSQLLWTELQAVIPETIQDEVAGSRVGTDFFVAMVYLTILYGLVALGLAGTEHVLNPNDVDWPLMLQGAGALTIGPLLCYQLAVLTTDYSASAVRAAVNLGRPKLAEAFGLAMPATFDEERDLWAGLCDLVRDPYDVNTASRLDAYRIPAVGPASDVPRHLEIVRGIRGQSPAAEVAREGRSDADVTPRAVPTAMWMAAAALEFLILIGLVILFAATFHRG